MEKTPFEVLQEVPMKPSEVLQKVPMTPSLLFQEYYSRVVVGILGEEVEYLGSLVGGRWGYYFRGVSQILEEEGGGGIPKIMCACWAISR